MDKNKQLINALVNSLEFQAIGANYLLGKNDAFEQAAKWIENQGLSDKDERVREFATSMAMSLRAHKVRL